MHAVVRFTKCSSLSVQTEISLPHSQRPLAHDTRPIAKLPRSVSEHLLAMASRSLTLSICQSCLRAAPRTRPSTGARQLRLPSRSVVEEQQGVRVPHNLNLNLQSMSALFSTSSRSRKAASSATPPPSAQGGPIVLEQPDKFRPPSHPQRLGRRRPQPTGYNQGTTGSEREKQKTRSYPHMFPNQGTFMHWFLTNRMIHMWITLVSSLLLSLSRALSIYPLLFPYLP